MNFNIENLWVLEIANAEIWITRTMVNTWILMGILIAFAIFVRIKLRNFKEVPEGFQNKIEAIIEMFDNFVRNAVGEELMPLLGNWFFAAFAFILLSNVSGLVGLRPPTADWTTTFAYSLATFILIQVVGIKYRKGAYIKSFFEPHPVFLPLNLIGELARPISLSFRLFGNVLSGMILLSLIYSLAPVFLRFGLPIPLHAYFDVILGAIQTYIFCILSLMFIKGAAE